METIDLINFNKEEPVLEPKVSIIILNWNGLKDTLECIESIKKSDYLNYKIILVDNASKTNEGDIVKSRFPEIELVQNKINLGFTGGSNVGMRYALTHGADYVWLLNNDTVVEANTLAELVKVAENVPNLGLISPLIYYYATKDKIQFCGSYFDKAEAKVRNIKEICAIDDLSGKDVCLWGTALLVSKHVVETVGYLNEKFFAYHEDMDYSLRALSHGFINKIVPSSKIFHKHHYLDNDNLKHLPPHYIFYMIRNDFWLWKNYAIGSKISFSIRRYIAKAIRQSGYFQESLGEEYVDASLDGICNALRNIGGSWDKRARMPFFLKSLLMMHPYFLADLMDLNFKNIFKKILSQKKASL